MILRLCGLCMLAALLNSAWANAPEILRSTTFGERGEFQSVYVDDERSPSHSVTLVGTSTQGFFRFLLANLDSAGEANWSHSWGSGDICYGSARFPDSTMLLIGRTTQNPTIDFRMMIASWDGSLRGIEDFGSDTTDDGGLCIATIGADSVAIAGRAERLGDSGSDLILAVTDLEATDPTYAYIEQGAVGYALETVDDSLIRIYGATDSDSLQGSNFLMVRTWLDSLGEAADLWEFGGPEDDVCHDAVRISADLTVLVGETRSYSASPTESDIWVLATNDNGDSLWSGIWGGGGDDAALAVEAVPDEDEGVIVAGYRSDTAGVHHAMLMKLNQAGDSLWARIIVDTVRTEFAAVTYDSGYHYHAAGVIQPQSEYGYYVVTEPDPAAPMQHPPSPFSLLEPQEGDTVSTDSIRFTWEVATDPDPEDEVAYAVLVDSDTLFEEPLAFGPLLQASFTWGTDTDDVFLYWRVVASDPQNNLRICRERHRRLLRVIPDSTEPFSLQYPDSGAVLTTPFSEFRWDHAVDPDSFDTVTYDLVFEIRDTSLVIEGLVDTFLNVDFADNPVILQSDTVTWYVLAHSLLPEMVLDSRERWTFVNWNEATGPISGPVYGFALSAAYPNPFNATTTIPYTIDRMGEVQLEIFDVQGRLVRTLVSGMRLPGSYRAKWDGGSVGGVVASGVYFARLRAGARVATTKLIHMR